MLLLIIDELLVPIEIKISTFPQSDCSNCSLWLNHLFVFYYLITLFWLFISRCPLSLSFILCFISNPCELLIELKYRSLFATFGPFILKKLQLTETDLAIVCVFNVYEYIKVFFLFSSSLVDVDAVETFAHVYDASLLIQSKMVLLHCCFLVIYFNFLKIYVFMLLMMSCAGTCVVSLVFSILHLLLHDICFGCSSQQSVDVDDLDFLSIRHKKCLSVYLKELLIDLTIGAYVFSFQRWQI